MAKKGAAKSKEVKVLANGTKRVVLMFPGGISLKAKKKVAYSDIAKVLGEEEAGNVAGQCWSHRCSLTAIGAVRG